MTDKTIPASGQALGEAMMRARAKAAELDAAYADVRNGIENTVADAREANPDFQRLGLGFILKELHDNEGNEARALALHQLLDKQRRALGWSKPAQLTRGPGGR